MNEYDGDVQNFHCLAFPIATDEAISSSCDSLP